MLWGNKPADKPLRVPCNQAADAVLAKIKRTYHIDDAQLHLDSAQQAIVDRTIDDFFSDMPVCRNSTPGSVKWHADCKKLMAPSLLGFSKKPKIDAEALKQLSRETIQQIFNALYVREVVFQSSPEAIDSDKRAFYSLDHTQHSLANIYINHVTNDAFRKFQKLGIDEVPSRELLGYCIQCAAMTYPKIAKEPYTSNVVSPVIGSTRGKSRQTLRQEQDKLENYWRDIARVMENSPDNPYRNR